jgi:hypothetical protein
MQIVPGIKTHINTVQNRNFYIFIVIVLFYRFMQQLEDSLNIGLCGHFLILLAILCMAAFSVVAVQYKKVYKMIQFEHYNIILPCIVIINIAVYVLQPAASIIRINNLSVIFNVTSGHRPTQSGLPGYRPHIWRFKK